MMPFSKEKNRHIYITALVISALLIVGSIYLHLRQKTHLGRISFNLNRDPIKPTSGVDLESTTWIYDYDSKYTKVKQENHNTGEDVDKDNDILEASTPEDADTLYTNSRQFGADNDIGADSDEDNNDDTYEDNDEDINEYIVDDNKDDSELNLLIPSNSGSCLRCLCMTINECRPTFCGSGNPCGLFRISKLYWFDSGKPTIAGGSVDNEDQDYLTCVNDATCSAAVIRQYYNRYKRDCNNDGNFDCKDLISLHILGPSGCLTENLSHIHASRMNNCFIESNLDYFSYSSEESY